MEEQYRDYFGNPITKKEYKERMDYKKKARKKQKEKDRKRLQKRFHDDGATPSQKLRDHFKEEGKRATGEGTSRIFKYKKDPYAGKVQEPTITNKKYSQPRSSNYDEMTMEQLMDELKKQTDKKKKRKKTKTKLYGRPIKKGEIGI